MSVSPAEPGPVSAVRKRRELKVESPIRTSPVIIQEGFDNTTARLGEALSTKTGRVPMIIKPSEFVEGLVTVIAASASPTGSPLLHYFGETLQPKPLILGDVPSDLRSAFLSSLIELEEAGFPMVGTTWSSYSALAVKSISAQLAKRNGIASLPGFVINPVSKRRQKTEWERIESDYKGFFRNTELEGGSLAWARPLTGERGRHVSCVSSVKQLRDVFNVVQMTKTKYQVQQDALNLAVWNQPVTDEWGRPVMGRNDTQLVRPRLVRADVSIHFLSNRGADTPTVHTFAPFVRVQTRPFAPCNLQHGAQLAELDSVHLGSPKEPLMKPAELEELASRYCDAVDAPYGRVDFWVGTMPACEPTVELISLLESAPDSDAAALVDIFTRLRVGTERSVWLGEGNNFPEMGVPGSDLVAGQLVDLALGQSLYV